MILIQLTKMQNSVQVKMVVVTPGGCSCQVSVDHEGVPIPGGSSNDDPVPLVVCQTLDGVVLDVDRTVAEVEGVLIKIQETLRNMVE